jgi:ADP-ribose pyrophosphatase YjhB (NUDIX family)
MEVSAGLLIIQDNKILLGHPTSAPYFGSYTIPKGKVEEGESYLIAALRETREEVGIDVNPDDIVNKDNPFLIEYKNEKNVIYKKLYYFVVQPREEIIIDKDKLQKREIDWAGFLGYNDSMARIFWRYEEMLNYID